MPERRPLTDAAHERWNRELEPASWVVDATAGNGNDTVWLARCVGPSGRVFTLDIQESAIRSTAALLEKENLAERVTLIRGDHARLEAVLPCSAAGRIALACFNLGYLPTGDHSITTRAESTTAALRACESLIRQGGLLSVIAYRGHTGGMEEARAVDMYLRQEAGKWMLEEEMQTGSTANPGPVWWLARRCGSA